LIDQLSSLFEFHFEP